MKNIVNKQFLFILCIIFLFTSCYKQEVKEDVYNFKIEEIKHEYVQPKVKPFITDNRKITQTEYEEINEYLPELIEGQKYDDEWYLYEVDFEKSNIADYQKFYQSYGNLFLKYKKEDIYFRNYKTLNFPITEVLYLYKENEEYKLLGKKNISGIYNNKDKLILKCPETANTVVGYTSQELFKHPFSNGLCLKKDDFTIFPCDSFGSIHIDYSNNTITTKSMEEILVEACRDD